MSDRLVTVGMYWSYGEAAVARNCIEAAGIRAFLSDEHLVNAMWQYANAVGGIKLQVGNSDADQSREILTASDGAHLPASDDVQGMQPLAAESAAGIDNDDRDEPDRPRTTRDENADRACRGAVLSLLFPLILPVQLYVFWLLLRVFISREELSPTSRRAAILAAIINIPLMFGFGYFIVVVVAGW